MTLALVPQSRLRVAVVGHVEWVQFGRVPRLPRAGEVVDALEPFEEPAGGGAVAAVQLSRLAGSAQLLTVLGEDDHARRASRRLGELGVGVRARIEGRHMRTAVTLVEREGERTITTFGERLDPVGERDGADWAGLSGSDGIYFTAGDLAALQIARDASRVLVASPRATQALGNGVRLDALVLSADDEIELRAAARAEAEADVVVLTEGAEGGRYRERSGAEGRWQPAEPQRADGDSYGCGDSFAAGLTYGLAAGLALADALALAARCGATCLSGRGPYERQLRAGEL